MVDSQDLAEATRLSRRMQASIRKSTFAPEENKELRRFSSWEVQELILGINENTFRDRLNRDPTLPQGEVEEGGRQRWFSLSEINTIRRKAQFRSKDILPHRPPGKRPVRAAVANFKGGAGKSTVALHFAHAAALDGYRVLTVDFDPQATLSHSMGITDVNEERTVWGIMVRDLIQETEQYNADQDFMEPAARRPKIKIPSSVAGLGISNFRTMDFVQKTCWPTVDIIPSCANAAFVEFAAASYRQANPNWSFFAALDRYLDEIPGEAYDIIIFDCPPAIGYQSMNAVFAADILYIPTGPGYWEYDSTTSFMGQLSDALSEIGDGYKAQMEGKLPKRFLDVKVLLTRFESSNELHVAMQEALEKVFRGWMTENGVELTRAVEQSGRFLQSIYEIDYRTMTRTTWRRARNSFDQAYREFHGAVLKAWDQMAKEEADG